MAPVVAAFSAIAASTVGSLILSTVARLALSYALSKLLAPDVETQEEKDPGLRTKVTLAGGTNPLSIIMGKYCTAGVWVSAPYTHGKVNGIPNAYLTYIIELADMPCPELDGLIIDGQYVTIGSGTHADYGNKIMGKFENKAWIKFKDGTQTTADPDLLAKYGALGRRPWKSDMIGRGVPYAILTFRRDANLFPDYPQVKFVLRGRWYDPRKDSTAGGSGSHRWNNQSTWEPSENPMVLIYNIRRGIKFQDGSHWGGYYAVDELPFDNWVAAMNVCDQPIALKAGGTQPRYRAGREFLVSDEPAAAEDDLLAACDGRRVDLGGVIKVRAGGPGLPVLTLTDKDIIITREQSYDPYPGIDEVYNAVHATYPKPGNLWEETEAPIRLNPTYEADDGGQRRPKELGFPTVSVGQQVQRLMKATMRRGRQFRTASLVLPPFGLRLEPLDTVAWNSERNDFAAKVFDIEQTADEPMLMLQGHNMRETKPDDGWLPAEEEDEEDVPDAPENIGPAMVPVFAASPAALTDSTATNRRPAITLAWVAADLDDVTGIEYELRRQLTTSVIGRGVITDVAAGAWPVTDGILPSTSYEVRSRLVIPGIDTDWSAWTVVTTGAVLLLEKDLNDASVTTAKLAPYAATRVLYAFDSETVVDISSSGAYMFIDNVSDVLDHSAEKLVIFSATTRWAPPSGQRYERFTVSIRHEYNPGTGLTSQTRTIIDNVWSPSSSTFVVRGQVCIAFVIPASVSPDSLIVSATFTGWTGSYGGPDGDAWVSTSRLIMMNIKR